MKTTIFTKDIKEAEKEMRDPDINWSEKQTEYWKGRRSQAKEDDQRFRKFLDEIKKKGKRMHDLGEDFVLAVEIKEIDRLAEGEKG